MNSRPMSNIDKRELRKAAMHAKTTDDWGCDADNFHDKATPDAVLALLDELEAVNELFMRAKALMYQSGGTPIENSLNPIDAWLYDAERRAAAAKGE